METLGETIASTCPAAFSGTSGALFINAVTAVIAAHCGILDNEQWPKDNSEEILRNVDEAAEITYDFIVVGAGTAGSIVASGLAHKFTSQSVLLIESGEDPGLDSEIPGLMFLNQNGKTDWNYKTKPDGRSCLGFRNNSCIWSKGRAMGGSGSINAMLYIRGHPNDYDTWNQNGVTGWSYEELKPFFEKIEDKLHIDECKIHNSPWDQIIGKAWNQLGFGSNNDNEARVGTKKAKLLTRNGKRLNIAKIYLSSLRNLHIMKNSIVTQVFIDETSKTAKSVKIHHASGISKIIGVKKDVILSAGSIGSPQILMNSGIGLATDLESYGVKCLANLSVGQNLQDHVLLPIYLKTNLHTSFTQQDLVAFIIQYMLRRTGPFANIGITDFMGFLNNDNSSDFPDVQFHHAYFTKNDHFIAPFLQGVGYKDEIIEELLKFNKKTGLLGIYPTLIHPQSRGKVLLQDTKTKPLIITNYFTDRRDLDTLIKAIDFVLKLTDSDSFKALGIEMLSLNIPGCSEKTGMVEYWECYIRYMATTIYHPVGTAKMGRRSDDGVVNENLLVHGFRNLRVVDASVMPTIPSSNTMSPTMVIGEKAVDIIAKYYRDRSEL